MSALGTVLAELQAQFDSYKPGTTAQPLPGTVEWFRLRVVALGLSYLKQLEATEVGERPEACERTYRLLSKDVKHLLRNDSSSPRALDDAIPFPPDADPSARAGTPL